MGDDLNEILNECAILRGTYPYLMHRTLHEFEWFVSAVIWGGIDDPTMSESTCQENKRIYDRWNKTIPRNRDDSLLWYAKAFLEYCKEEYGK